MPLQGEYEPSSQKWVRDQVEEYESSGGTRGTRLRDVPVIVVTSMGSKSGKLRKNPVMRVEHDGSYAAVASKGGAPEHPAWYRNLVDHPQVEVQDEQAKGDYTARMARLRRLPDEDRSPDPGVVARADRLTADSPRPGRARRGRLVPRFTNSVAVSRRLNVPGTTRPAQVPRYLLAVRAAPATPSHSRDCSRISDSRH
jgi:F420H(2)-dependent quinone reductase